jgi:hypothetical protein
VMLCLGSVIAILSYHCNNNKSSGNNSIICTVTSFYQLLSEI